MVRLYVSRLPELVIFFFSPTTPIIAIALFWCGTVVSTLGIDFAEREEQHNSVTDNGTVTLEWVKDPATVVELQQSPNAEFSDPLLRYQGVDPASVITGLSAGDHFFRIREEGSDSWSPPLKIQVEFVSRRKLVLLLSLGATVVICTVGAIISGWISHRREVS